MAADGHVDCHQLPLTESELGRKWRIAAAVESTCGLTVPPASDRFDQLLELGPDS